MGFELTRSEALDLGRRLQEDGAYDRAMEVYGQILRAWPDEPKALNNLAVLLKRRMRFQEAAVLLKTAVSLEPATAGLLANLGNTLRELGDLGGAAARHREAIRLDPENGELHVGFAFILLAQGLWREGFAEYEWRDQRRKLAKSAEVTGIPVWQGETLAGRTILLHSEQGMGDTLNFARYAILLQERGARVVVRCQPDLIPLIRTVPGVAEVFYEEDIPHDVQDLMMSLPWRFGTMPETIPGSVPYVCADATRVASWRRRLDAAAGPDVLRVGVIWAGNPAFQGDERRSPRLEPLLPLFSVPGTHMFGLQMGDGRRDLEGRAMPANFTDLGPEISGFADTAAIMENLDLVVSSCTAPAHLAGALGRPTWLLLPFAADWRWLLDRDDSPWYPTVRLFRQHIAGDWASPVAGMVNALSCRAAKGPWT